MLTMCFQLQKQNLIRITKICTIAAIKQIHIGVLIHVKVQSLSPHCRLSLVSASQVKDFEKSLRKSVVQNPKQVMIQSLLNSARITLIISTTYYQQRKSQGYIKIPAAVYRWADLGSAHQQLGILRQPQMPKHDKKPFYSATRALRGFNNLTPCSSLLQLPTSQRPKAP